MNAFHIELWIIIFEGLKVPQEAIKYEFIYFDMFVCGFLSKSERIYCLQSKVLGNKTSSNKVQIEIC